MMNVSSNLFLPSKGVEVGIRHELLEVVMHEFGAQDVGCDVQMKKTASTDGTSDKILSNIREGSEPVLSLLQELLKNKQFITEDTNALLMVISSIFLGKNEYETLVQTYITKLLDPSDTIYTLLMISINRANSLKEENLLSNWTSTFGMVVVSFLNNASVQGVKGDQVQIYIHKLGMALFNRARSLKERWMGQFFIFAAKQVSLFDFLNEKLKNSWRTDLDYNILLTIENLLYEEHPDAYQVTMLKLGYYRACLLHQAGTEYYELALKLLVGVLKKKQYLKMYQLEETAADAEKLRDEVSQYLNQQAKLNEPNIPEQNKQGSTHR